MADRKISDLTALTAPASGDYLPIVDISEVAAASKNKRITIEELFRGVPLGTAAAPSIAIEGDENTGIYSPGADQVAISTGGTQRLLIKDSSQDTVRVSGVNAAVIADATGSNFPCIRLAADGSSFAGFDGSAGNFALLTTFGALPLTFGTNSNERLRITSAGLVGLGTSSVASLLHLASSGPVLTLQRSDSASPGCAIHFTNNTGGVNWQIGTNQAVGASAFEINAGNQSNNRFVITSAGAVGIGTTNPGCKLRLEGTADSSDATLVITSAGVASMGFACNSTGAVIGTDTGGILLKTGISTSTPTTTGSERARIDSSGRLLVGTSTARSNFYNTTLSALFQVEGANAGNNRSASVVYGEASASGPIFILGKHRSNSLGGVTVVSADDQLGTLSFQGSDGTEFVEGASIRAFVDGTPGADDLPSRLVFSTTADGASSPTERARITSGGFTKFSNTGNYNNSSGSFHESFTAAQNYAHVLSNANATAAYGIRIVYTARTPNSTAEEFIACDDLTTSRFVVRSNGGIANYSANDVNLSDRNVKKDITPAGGTWNCLKEWEIVNFRYKDQAADSDLNLGVIAQQIAESCPEVITVFQEAKEATEDHPAQEERLGVKDQQMMWMAIKALQEAQLRIETLEAKVAALEAV